MDFWKRTSRLTCSGSSDNVRPVPSSWHSHHDFCWKPWDLQTKKNENVAGTWKWTSPLSGKGETSIYPTHPFLVFQPFVFFRFRMVFHPHRFPWNMWTHQGGWVSCKKQTLPTQASCLNMLNNDTNDGVVCFYKVFSSSSWRHHNFQFCHHVKGHKIHFYLYAWHVISLNFTQTSPNQNTIFPRWAPCEQPSKPCWHSMKSWLVNRNPYFMAYYYNPYITG